MGIPDNSVRILGQNNKNNFSLSFTISLSERKGARSIHLTFIQDYVINLKQNMLSCKNKLYPSLFHFFCAEGYR
jgi:hypothetical protein